MLIKNLSNISIFISPYCLSLQEEELHESSNLPQPSNKSTSSDNLSWIVCEGEKVRVGSDESVAIRLQEDVTGRNDAMRNVNNNLFYTYLCSMLHLYRYIQIFNNVQYHNGWGPVTTGLSIPVIFKTHFYLYMN